MTAITVDNLSKTYRFHRKEPGLRGSIAGLLRRGVDVVSDDTNLPARMVRDLRRLATAAAAERDAAHGLVCGFFGRVRVVEARAQDQPGGDAIHPHALGREALRQARRIDHHRSFQRVVGLYPHEFLDRTGRAHADDRTGR